MKTRILVATLLLMAGAVAGADDFTIASADVGPGKTTAADFVFNGFGCSGGNYSPELHWSGAPEGTQSFALTVYDPDAPTGSGWWHWFVVNLPATTTSLPRGAGSPDGAKLPAGARQVRTDFGTGGYGGPCPPEGDHPHRYIITLHALKVPKLDLPADATAALAGYTVNANSIGATSITFRYGR